MRKLLGLAILTLILIGGGVAFAGTGCISDGVCDTTTSVSVSITGGTLCIGSSGAFNFGTYQVSASSQTVTGSFATGYFYVDDLKGADSGYYTTVQMSGHLMGTGGIVISGSNVYMQSSTTPTLLNGRANARVIVRGGMASFQSLDSARQLILRSGAANLGLLSMYGVLPTMQLVIPAYQPVGTYLGTLVYTLYEN
ncbi:MAG: hypothetical protein WC004_01325 [Candidatus Absconditabacterales bacterium]